MVIAGHRDSFFWPLRNIQFGDDIFLDTPKGQFHYRVTSMRVVNSHDLSVLEPTDSATLTLITCYPFWVLGNAPDRFVVRAARVAEPTAAAFEPRTLPAPEPVDPPVVAETIAAYNAETLVRHAIERFRLTYNARLIAHNDNVPTDR